MLAKMSAALHLIPKPVSKENLYELRDLLAARRALIKDSTAAKARIAVAALALIKRQLVKRIHRIKGDLAQIEATILELDRKDQ